MRKMNVNKTYNDDTHFNPPTHKHVTYTTSAHCIPMTSYFKGTDNGVNLIHRGINAPKCPFSITNYMLPHDILAIALGTRDKSDTPRIDVIQIELAHCTQTKLLYVHIEHI